MAPASRAPLVRKAHVKQKRLSLQMKPAQDFHTDTTQIIGLLNSGYRSQRSRDAHSSLSRPEFPFKCEVNPLKVCHVHRYKDKDVAIMMHIRMSENVSRAGKS